MVNRPTQRDFFSAARRKTAGLVAALIVVLSSAGCAAGTTTEGPLDPEHPVTIVLWNYYNGQIKGSFDSLVNEFNDTVGMEQGIIVETVSHGDIQGLAEEVFRAAELSPGSEKMPDLFAAYPDNAFRVDQLGGVANLDQYFSAEELSRYRQDFLLDCRFGSDGALKQIPTVRSTEVLYLNQTDWDKFAQATGADRARLSSWEGVAALAEQYYHWTDEQTPEPDDGEAFLGVDSLANYMLSTALQLGAGLYQQEGQQITWSFDREVAQVIWDNLYRSFLCGYYANIGSFRSDDAKTGNVLAYVGSSAGAHYFPLEVTKGRGQAYPIESTVLPYPVFEGGTPYAIGQGAGFAVTKSDLTHEYASSVLLKWLSNKEQNAAFSVQNGYLPVTEDALAMDLPEMARLHNVQYGENPAVARAMDTTGQMVIDYRLYSNPPFQGSYEVRRFLEHSLLSFAEKSRGELESSMRGGMSRDEGIEVLLSPARFEEWYPSFTEQVTQLWGS